MGVRQQCDVQRVAKALVDHFGRALLGAPLLDMVCQSANDIGDALHGLGLSHTRVGGPAGVAGVFRAPKGGSGEDRRGPCGRLLHGLWRGQCGAGVHNGKAMRLLWREACCPQAI